MKECGVWLTMDGTDRRMMKRSNGFGRGNGDGEVEMQA